MTDFTEYVAQRRERVRARSRVSREGRWASEAYPNGCGRTPCLTIE